ncbi:TRAM domain-containing protein [Candidatus Woesearchaeota archaeon]|nr:TRAM domain-containing protein [Candidatus Woesearchaeota archaeon]
MDRFNGGFRRRNSFAPVKIGDEIDVKIEAVGEKGDGIAKKKGFVLFIPDVKVNDEVRIRVTKVLNKVGFAESLGAAQGPIEVDEKPTQRRDDVVEVPVARRTEEINISDIDTDNDTEDFGEELDSSDDDEDQSEEDDSEEQTENSEEKSQEDSDDIDEDQSEEDDSEEQTESFEEESQEDSDDIDEDQSEEDDSEEQTESSEEESKDDKKQD